uniref:Uncharacterized protein n=1 Tax=Rhizophora mucronata TaxID=61149 RepID=A0A2P2QLS4_RHIMU
MYFVKMKHGKVDVDYRGNFSLSHSVLKCFTMTRNQFLNFSYCCHNTIFCLKFSLYVDS